MTFEKSGTFKRHGKNGFKTLCASLASGRLFLFWLAVFSMAMMLKNSALTVECVKKGLCICTKNVIPSLFPFMVLSELAVTLGFPEAIGRLFAAPMRKVFGVSGNGSVAVILGAVCGFPVGAATAVSLYDNGNISRRECEHLLTFANYPSAAFVIGAVGTSLYKNRTAGVVLWALTVLSSALVGILMRRAVYGGRGHSEEIPTKAATAAKVSGAKTFTSAVAKSATSMLNVCAYVVFFSALVGAVGSIFDKNGSSDAVRAAVFAVFEISSGVGMAAGLENRALGLVITAFALGWSGISVHCQVMSVCDGRGLSFKPYFAAKLLEGLINAAAVFALLVWRPSCILGAGG